MSCMEDPNKVREVLDSIGPGFCLAKWNQVSIHLGRGLTHSCYHPQAHELSEKEVLSNPSALHNSGTKKLVRKCMLEGKRPEECSFCWEIEDRLKGCLSDRITKSAEDWAWPTLDKVRSLKWDEDYTPTYVELSFSNRCNFKCLYCNPDFSSSWQQEAKVYGQFHVMDDVVVDIPVDKLTEQRCRFIENNPYVKAFWKWWPTLFPKLHTFRLTGGDPLLVPETYQVLEYIQEHWKENPNITLAINTNLGISDSQFEKLINIFKDLGENGKVKELQIFTSIESSGKQAEYVRNGLNEVKFWNRIEIILKELPKVSVHIMATYNILCVETFSDIIRKVYDLKIKYNGVSETGCKYIRLGTFHLLFPAFMSAKLCSNEQRVYVDESKALMESYPRVELPWGKGFTQGEVDSFLRIHSFVYDVDDSFDREKLMKQLHIFVTEMDLRRDTNFFEAFPNFKF